MKTVTLADSCDYLNENPHCMHIEKSKIFVKSYYSMGKIPKCCKGPEIIRYKNIVISSPKLSLVMYDQLKQG